MSIVNLVVIAVNRYIGIVYSSRYDAFAFFWTCYDHGRRRRGEGGMPPPEFQTWYKYSK